MRVDRAAGSPRLKRVVIDWRRRLAVSALWLGLALGGCDASGPPSSEGQDPQAQPSVEAVPEPVHTALLELGDPELEPFKGDLDVMEARGVVRALVAPSRTDFFLDHGRIQGLQAELLREFESFLNRGRAREADRIRVKLVPVSFVELIPALEAGKGDLVAAFLTETPQRQDQVQIAAGMRNQVAEVLVTHDSVASPGTLDGLGGREVYLLAGSSYAEHLRQWNARAVAEGRAPIELVRADPRLESEDILELVHSGVVERTFVDDYKARLWARVLPGIAIHEDVAIARDRTVGWAVRRDSILLAEALERFTDGARGGTLLGNVLFERYFVDDRFVNDPTESSERDKLDKYLELFERYGTRYGFEPLALAAQAYQESHLDHSLRSPRGAVGLMQLLPTTATDTNVGIPNISEVDANVHAGARYMAFLRDRYFSAPEIDAWNRTALALAAYNAGPRRIREARTRTTELGLDPNVWFDNVEVATGRLVGREPVRYVANIYKYFVAYRLALGREADRRSARPQ